jgi:hypothetical protein
MDTPPSMTDKEKELAKHYPEASLLVVITLWKTKARSGA